MISLQLLKYLENNGYGTIDQDLLWEKETLDKKGIFIVSNSEQTPRGSRRTQRFTLYSRGTNDVDGYKKLEAIRNFLSSFTTYENCTLPAVPPIVTEPVNNVTIMPMSTIDNVGRDENGRLVWSCNGYIYY